MTIFLSEFTILHLHILAYNYYYGGKSMFFFFFNVLIVIVCYNLFKLYRF